MFPRARLAEGQDVGTIQRDVKGGSSTFKQKMAGLRSHIAKVEIEGDVVPGSHSDAPTTLEQDVQAYKQRRAELIADEQSKRFDHLKKSAGLSDLEQSADKIALALRAEERKAIWERQGELEAFKGMEWQGAASKGARQGELYRLLRKMPKGGLLHCHMDGTVDAKWLIESSFDKVTSADLWVTSTRSLTTPESLYEAEIRFRHLPSKPDLEQDGGQERSTVVTLYTDAYKPNTWVRVVEARASFPHPDVYDPIPTTHTATDLPNTGKTSQEKAFDHYIHSLLTLTTISARFTTPIKTSKQAWTKFLQTFRVISGLFGHEPMLKRYFVESLRILARDGVSYVEARINFFLKEYTTSEGRLELKHPDWIHLFQEALAEVRAEPGLDLWDAKIIYSTVRIMPDEDLRWHVENAIALKQQFPDTIVGFDLVGWEDQGVTLHDYLPELLRMKRRCNELGVDLPFVLHAGETLADGDPIDHNVSGPLKPL